MASEKQLNLLTVAQLRKAMRASGVGTMPHANQTSKKDTVEWILHYGYGDRVIAAALEAGTGACE